MAAFYIKRRGAWAAASKVWKKVSGAWVEQTDLPSLALDNVRYQSHSETVSVAVTGTGNSGYCYVVINGITYTSAASISVARGTEIKCHVGTAMTGYGASIKLNGTQVSTSDYTYTVSENCTISLTYTNMSTYIRYGTISITTT